MASRMLITEVSSAPSSAPPRCLRVQKNKSELSRFVYFLTQRQRLISSRTLTNGDSDIPAKGVGGARRGVENGLAGAERGLRRDGRDDGNETENEETEDNEHNDEEEEEEEGEGPFVPFQCPGTSNLHICKKKKILLSIITPCYLLY